MEIFCRVIFVSLILGPEMASSALRIPPEWEPHTRTCMVWPATPSIWGTSFIPKVRDDIARIAKAIAPYEAVTLIVDPSQISSAQDAFTTSELERISILPIPVDDLWARDTLPIFGIETSSNGSKSLVGIDLNFNGWGKKQKHSKDAQLASAFLEQSKIPRISSKIVGEGGSLEFDGEGTLLLTESSLFNANRNPTYESREDLESELKSLFNLDKVIWFKGVVGQDITDAHVDSLVRFVRPGVVLLNRPPKGSTKEDADVWSRSSDEAKQVLEKEVDAKGRSFRVVSIYEPDPDKMVKVKGRESEFLSSYVNYLVVNGAVIMPLFGDAKADAEAKKVLEHEYPGRKVVGVSMPYLASGGGGIHCATHDMPSLDGVAGEKSGAAGLRLF